MGHLPSKRCVAESNDRLVNPCGARGSRRTYGGSRARRSQTEAGQHPTSVKASHGPRVAAHLLFAKRGSGPTSPLGLLRQRRRPRRRAEPLDGGRSRPAGPRGRSPRVGSADARRYQAAPPSYPSSPSRSDAPPLSALLDTDARPRCISPVLGRCRAPTSSPPPPPPSPGRATHSTHSRAGQRCP
jgi:hypothetical protein